MVLVEFLKHWNYVELHFVELVVGHIYLPLDALWVHILDGLVVLPLEAGSHSDMRLILAVHHIKRHCGELLLSEGIFDQEDLLLSVNVEVLGKVGAEDVGILSRCEKVYGELSEPVDLVPHDLAFPLFVLNPLVDEAAATGNPLKHLSQVIVEVHVLLRP